MSPKQNTVPVAKQMEKRNIPAGLPTCPKASASQLLQVQPDFPDSPPPCAHAAGLLTRPVIYTVHLLLYSIIICSYYVVLSFLLLAVFPVFWAISIMWSTILLKRSLSSVSINCLSPISRAATKLQAYQERGSALAILERFEEVRDAELGCEGVGWWAGDA